MYPFEKRVENAAVRLGAQEALVQEALPDHADEIKKKVDDVMKKATTLARGQLLAATDDK